jgi:hypothetical protein
MPERRLAGMKFPAVIILGGSPGVMETFKYAVMNGKTIAQPRMSGGCVWTRD